MLCIILFCLIAAISRIVPHLAGMSAFPALALLLGQRLRLPYAIGLFLTFSLAIDWLLMTGTGYTLFANWIVFNYSAYLLIIILGYCFVNQTQSWRLFGSISIASLMFWLWTNAGVWLSSGMYPHTSAGLIQCYWLALPFLRNALIGDGLWYLFILIIAYPFVTGQAIVAYPPAKGHSN